ncbi:MAG: RIP metalloprotease RseP [Deltaproteobacteria bacterium]|nr:RIP metalloprotease RseP [Deltaproteobacteria bacterium]
MHFFLFYILPFVVVLGVLIFFHELGHFLVAKYFKVKVLKFSLGFGPKLVGKEIGETEYLISAFPLGGYVKMLGEGDDDEEVLTPEDEKRSFNNQPALKRIAIVAAGPFFNLVLALLIFCICFMFSGNQILIPEVGQVNADSPAGRAGFIKGDVIVSIGEKPVNSWSEVKEAIQHSSGMPLEITVNREDDNLTMTVIPEESVVKNIFGENEKVSLIGIVASGRFKQISLSPLESIKAGFLKTWEIIWLTCLTIVKLFQGIIPVKTLGGPILIGQMTGELAQQNFSYLFPFMAVISINLGILNLLPVPILDGGLIFFIIIELISGKPLSLKKREIAQKTGLFILISIMVIVMFNDVSRLFE